MSEKDHLNAATNEVGHATVCYYAVGANKLYNTTIVARGGNLEATFMELDESDMFLTQHCNSNRWSYRRKVIYQRQEDQQDALETLYRSIMIQLLNNKKA